MIDFAKLAAPFDPADIEWRLGNVSSEQKKGKALCYIDARTVANRLDEVCGPAGWQCRYPHAGQKTVCEIGIRCIVPGGGNGVSLGAGGTPEWIWKADGAGDSDIEAEKGALSDAFKRAAVRWQIGRYLYDIKSPWVEVEQAGNTRQGKPAWKIRQAEYKNLDMVLRRATMAILGGVQKQPDAFAQARDDIAAMQNAGEQSSAPQPTHSRAAAEKFVGETLKTWAETPGFNLREWYQMPFSKTKTNEAKIDELQEKHPDLYDRLQVAADQVRLTAGPILQ